MGRDRAQRNLCSTGTQADSQQQIKFKYYDSLQRIPQRPWSSPEKAISRTANRTLKASAILAQPSAVSASRDAESAGYIELDMGGVWGGDAGGDALEGGFVYSDDDGDEVDELRLVIPFRSYSDFAPPAAPAAQRGAESTAATARRPPAAAAAGDPRIGRTSGRRWSARGAEDRPARETGRCATARGRGRC